MSKMPKKQKAVIIIPTYNEKENIKKLIPVIFSSVAEVKNWKVEVLVVDDTSPDKTYVAVKEMQKKFDKLHLLVNPEKAGLGGAYMKGMAKAFGELGADIIFEFDADFSHDPGKIPLFLGKIDEGYDFVIGGRYKDGGSIDPNWPLMRKFYSVVGNLIIMTVLTDFSIRDWTSGYRALTKQVYEAVITEMAGERFSGYTWQIGMLHKTVRAGFKVTEVPIQFIDRQVGESKLGSEYIKNTLIYIFQARANEIMQSRVFKFLCVGGLGTIIQLIVFTILKSLFGFNPNNVSNTLILQVATIISTEVAIVSNFVLNNAWTFSEQKISGNKIFPQFVTFNISSLGSLVIQQITMLIGSNLLGTNWNILFLDAATIYLMGGILLGLIWNYFAYNKFIWKTKKNI